MCVGAGGCLGTRGEERGGHQGPQPTTSQSKSWVLLFFCLGAKRHWLLSLSKLGCPSALTSAHTPSMVGMGVWRMGGRRQNFLEKSGRVGVGRKTPALGVKCVVSSLSSNSDGNDLNW